MALNDKGRRLYEKERLLPEEVILNGQYDPGEPSPDNDPGEPVNQQPQFTSETLSDVKPVKVSWLWEGYLPLGKLVTLDGDPGVGKSTLALTFAAIITKGGEWPDDTSCQYPGDVILMSAEDGLADTIRPRLDAAGADVNKVHAIKGVPLDGEDDALRMATLADVAMLREIVTRTQARLVIVDVLMAYIPTGTDSYRDQDMRRVLARLSALAESTDCTILLLRHLNKGKGDPLYRGGGSIGIVGASRVGLLAASDPEDEDIRVLAPIKNNLAPPQPSLTYRLTGDEVYDVGRIEWTGESTKDAYSLLSEQKQGTVQTTVEEATEWLADYMKGAEKDAQGRVKSRGIKDAAKLKGFSLSSIDRAASKLNMVIKSEGFPRITWWSLPATAEPQSRQSSQSRQSFQTRDNDATDPIEPIEPIEPQSSQSLDTAATDATDVTDATVSRFLNPNGSGRCTECGFHIPTQGHRNTCTANNQGAQL